MSSIVDLPDEPKYSIKTTCAQTGIRAVTLRAWERRYNLLNPKRADNQYRRYSEREIAILRWVKVRVDNGIPISSVVNEYKSMLAKGTSPEIIPVPRLASGKIQSNPPEFFAGELYKNLTARDERLAAETLQNAHAGLDLTAVCLNVITPCLVEIGEAWNRGELNIAGEHFASNFLRGHLISLFQNLPTRRTGQLIITGCAPDEHHGLGVLILSIFLRDAGYRVEYLGEDVPLNDLAEYTHLEKPAMICLGATNEQSALALAAMQEKLAKHKPIPIFGFGGQAFSRNSLLISKVPGVFLGTSALDAVTLIGKLI